MGAYARWRTLTRGEQRLAVQSWLTIAAASAGVRVFGVERTLRLASLAHPSTALGVTLSLSKGQGRRQIAGAKNVIGDVVTAVDRAGRYVPGGTCLPQSVALAWLLRRRGVDASVCIGTRKDYGRFEAHAWVEVAGVAINHAPPGYAALLTVHS